MSENLPWLLATVFMAATLLTIAVVDMRTFRIPNVLSLPLIAVGLAMAWALPGVVPDGARFHNHLIGAVAGWLFFAVLGEVLHRRTGQEALGLGDAKLMGAAGAWLGWQALPLVLLIASLCGLAFAVIARQRHGTKAIAFGPWIGLAFMVMWLSASWP
jgi:leader peptidase (prepilin peptidase) / N-methyltransferase